MLEDAFVEAVQRFKSADPLKPLLIVVPSDALRRYLMRLLTLKHGLNLIHVSLFNFNQLSNTLYEEAFPATDLSLHDDLFFEEMLHLLLQRSGSDFSEPHPSEGGTSALWQSLRDLKEGLLDPEIALQALKEGHFGRRAIHGRLPRLFKLYRQLKKTCEKQRIFDYGEISRRATAAVSNSAFLKSFGAIYYYGFYDLTQVLIDLLHEVSRHYAATLFYPLVSGAPAWHFSARFFERHVSALAGEKSEVIDLTRNASPALLFPHTAFFEESRPAPSPSSDKKTACTIISCYDLHDEVLTVAKEIMRLNSDKALAFHEIGIVARDPEAYLSPIQDIFQKHAIPIASSSEVPLMHYPLAKSVFLMTTLLAQDFPRAPCIDLMTSPFFKHREGFETRLLPKPEDWDFLSRKAKITKGWETWRKLEAFNKEKPGDHSDQAALLWSVFSSLYRDLNALPTEGRWSDYAESWQKQLEKYLGLAPPDELKTDETEMRPETDRIAGSILKILTRLASLENIADAVSRDDFIAAFQRGLKRATLPFATQNIAGTSLMNIMQSRGLSFRVLFMLGMNEGGFPRAIREDPFLKDPPRRVLETVLGCKVGEKLSGYDEEKLLFVLATGSATEKCYALYHRRDMLGKQSAPSWYLGELKRVFQAEDEIFIPRARMARHLIPPFDKMENLLPSEWAICFSLRRQDLNPIIDRLPFSKSRYLRGKTALEKLENDGPLSSFDGLISSAEAHWARLAEGGISPTRLESYAKCPFQYYGKYLLKLSAEADSEEEVLPKINDIGTLCHEILKVFYEGLQSEDGFTQALRNFDLTQDLERIGEPFFEAYISENPVLYPLNWEMLKTKILVMLSEVIENDLERLSGSGYRPAAFEVDCRQKLEAGWPEFRGKIDRIDFNPEDGRVRVVDYKITFRKAPRALEKNPLTSALRGERLQAPVYLRFAEIFVEAGAGRESGQTALVFYHLAPFWPGGPLVIYEFPESGWQGECGAMLKRTISALLQGIENGRFFMKPGDHCPFCEIRALCRKNHSPSIKRLQADPLWQAQQALQKLKPPKSRGKKKKEKPA